MTETPSFFQRKLSRLLKEYFQAIVVDGQKIPASASLGE